jgi:hypothetical protein
VISRQRQLRGPQPIIPFRVLEIALVVLVLLPFGIFVIRSRDQVLSRRIGDGRSAATQPTSAADARARLKTLRAQPRTRPAGFVVLALIVPLFWVGVFSVAGRRLFALRI